MISFQVTIKLNMEDRNVLLLPKPELAVSSNSQFKIIAGSRYALINLKIDKSNTLDNTLYLSKQTLKELLIPLEKRLWLKLDKNIAELGPLVGILVDNSSLVESTHGSFCNALINLFIQKRELGLCYFLSLRDIDWYKNEVKGVCQSSENSFEKYSLPIPKKIYDQTTNTRDSKKNSQLRKIYVQRIPGAVIVNPNINDMRLILQHLSANEEISKYVPPVLSFSKNAMLKLLHDGVNITIKSFESRQKEIIIIKNNQQSFQVEYQVNESLNVMSCANSLILNKHISSIMNSKREYYMQPRMEMASVEGNQYTLSILVQKTPALSWRVMVITAKVAPVGSTVTNYYNKGRVVRGQDVAYRCFGDKGDTLIKECTALALRIACELEITYPLLLEMEIILLVSLTGDIMIDEITEMPSKDDIIRLGDGVVTNLVHQLPILTCFSDTGFPARYEIKQHKQLLIQKYSFKTISQASDEKKLFLNPLQLKMFGLAPGKTITLQIGGYWTIVEIAEQTQHLEHTTLFITKTVMKEITFYHGEALQLYSYTGDGLFFGPTIGITIPQKIVLHKNKNQFLKKRALLARKKGMFLFCFSLAEVEWNVGVVSAYSLNVDGTKWIKNKVPVPQVLDDRGSYPSVNTTHGFCRREQVNSILWTNATRTYAKWETFSALCFFRDTAGLMPATNWFSRSVLEEYLLRYGCCYVKANFGRNGRKVFRVESHDSFYLCKSGGTDVKAIQFSDIENLFAYLRSSLGDNIIVQQEVKLAKIKNSPFDMRVLLQKNNNYWQISAVNFRIAKPGAVVTNYAAGASDIMFLPREKLPHTLVTWQNLEKFCLRVVFALEASFGCLAEVGIDAALDQDGILWLLEANSRPGSIAYRRADSKACSIIFGLPLDYAASLVNRLYNYYGIKQY